MDQSLDKIRANIKWRENYYENAARWFSDLTGDDVDSSKPL